MGGLALLEHADGIGDGQDKTTAATNGTKRVTRTRLMRQMRDGRGWSRHIRMGHVLKEGSKGEGVERLGNT